MIEASLLQSNFMGKDGFLWWIGQVAPASVWRDEKTLIDSGPNKKATKDNDTTGASWAYRCKVRIIGYHPFDREVLKDEDLPWAHVMTTGAEGTYQGGVGQTLRLTGGEVAFGFFLDGEDAQQPVVIGCIHRNESVKNFASEDLKTQLRPFTGHSGPLKQAATQIRKRNDGVQSGAKTSNTPLSGITSALSSAPTTTTSTREDSKPGADQAIREDLASQQFGDEGDICIVRENGCNDNLIGKISKILQDFIKFIGRIQSFIGTYIDPVLNTFVDIIQEIRGFARRIVGVVKFIVNNLRGAIIKLVTSLFRDFIAKVLPLPQHPPVAEATKNIINIIFCLFEKLIPLILDYIINMLTNMIGKTINAPLCAVEEFTAGILGKLMDFIEDLLGPVMSGLNWLLGGIGQISSVLSQVSSLAQQILNFIGCDQLKCETAAEWCSKTGSSKQGRDSWNRALKKLNFMKGINESIDTALGYSSLYGYTGDGPFKDCSEKSRNPKTQKDKTPMPSGMIASECIPPEIEIFGDGVRGQAVPIVDAKGQILTVQVVNTGKGYSKPPKINIIDNTGNGVGAQLESKINNGRIEAIYVKNTGFGYCQGNYSSLFVNPTYLVTANKYSLFEGETVTYYIQTENLQNGTVLSYELSGDVKLEDIESVSNNGQNTTKSFSGSITINNNSATVDVKIKQDSIAENVETMFFDLYDTEGSNVARVTILISNELSPTLAPEINNPIESPPGTIFPGDDGGTGGIGTVGLGQTIPITPLQPFPGIGTNVGVGTGVVGIITDTVVVNPGFGYTSGDKINFGPCQFGVIVTETGSIIGVTSSNCDFKFDELPVGEIDTTTGEGATVFPVLQYVPQFNKVTVINQVGILTVVDCV